MLIEIGVFFTNLVLIIFRIMTSVESPETFTQTTVNIFCLLDLFIFPHNHNIRLN